MTEAAPLPFTAGVLPSIEQFIGTWVISRSLKSISITGCPTATLPVPSRRGERDGGWTTRWSGVMFRSAQILWPHRWTAKRSEAVHSVAWRDGIWHSAWCDFYSLSVIKVQRDKPMLLITGRQARKRYSELPGNAALRQSLTQSVAPSHNTSGCTVWQYLKKNK